MKVPFACALLLSRFIVFPYHYLVFGRALILNRLPLLYLATFGGVSSPFYLVPYPLELCEEACFDQEFCCPGGFCGFVEHSFYTGVSGCAVPPRLVTESLKYWAYQQDVFDGLYLTAFALIIVSFVNAC